MPAPLPFALESTGSGNMDWAASVVCSHPLPLTWGEAANTANTHTPGGPGKAEADTVVV